MTEPTLPYDDIVAALRHVLRPYAPEWEREDEAPAVIAYASRHLPGFRLLSGELFPWTWVKLTREEAASAMDRAVLAAWWAPGGGLARMELRDGRMSESGDLSWFNYVSALATEDAWGFLTTHGPHRAQRRPYLWTTPPEGQVFQLGADGGRMAWAA